MSNFSHKDIYIEDGKRVLEVNILPEKYCNFDCIFCPIGRSKNKIDTQKSFDEVESSLIELEKKIEDTKPELIFINSKGEALVHDKIANKCDEVIGEIKVITEEHFKKVQRPIEGYTLKEYIENMDLFNKQYKGKFIFEITIVKGYNDDNKSVKKIKDIIKKISPDKVIVVRIDDEIFKKKLGISDERFDEISNELLNV